MNPLSLPPVIEYSTVPRGVAFFHVSSMFASALRRVVSRLTQQRFDFVPMFDKSRGNTASDACQHRLHNSHRPRCFRFSSFSRQNRQLLDYVVLGLAEIDESLKTASANCLSNPSSSSFRLFAWMWFKATSIFSTVPVLIAPTTLRST